MEKPFRGSLCVPVVLAVLSAASGCQSKGGDEVGAEVASVASALGGTTTTNLQLQVSKNACAANLAQNYFKVKNASSASLQLAKIAIKYWINDTSGTPITPSVFYGGCVTSANGTCVHPVTGVTASAVPVAPACGPDASHQASWEITISTTDTTALAAGQTWSNLQTAVSRSNHANFSPGTATWYSSCGAGQPYAADSRFAVYANGDLVLQQGVTVPSCRTPDAIQIQDFIDKAFYSSSEIQSSFVTSLGKQIDCIDFYAQRSVRAWQAKGVTFPTTFPPAPPRPSSMPPPNVAPDQLFLGQPDVNGHPQSCASSSVPSTRPTVAQIQAAGGLAAWQAAKRAPERRLAQHDTQHDCWLSSGPGDGMGKAYDWEHTAGVQNAGWSPSDAPGMYGAHIITPIYNQTRFDPASTLPNVTSPAHADSQFWIQSGGCENWYNEGATTNACATGTACTTCTGAACNGCAVQSLEIAALNTEGFGTAAEVFFTTDGYFTSCYAGSTDCVGCPVDPMTNMRTDCFVRVPGATFAPGTPLASKVGPDGTEYAVAPYEMEFSAYNASGIGFPGWYIYVNHADAAGLELIGFYPPETFNWSDGTPGPLSNGPATYLQAGGEVYHQWPGGFHTDTAMISDNAASSGYMYAAYNRNVGYYDAARIFHNASLTYITTPPEEGDNMIAGLCGLHAADWVDANGDHGGYSLSTTTPAPVGGWGTYHYFGGGLAKHQRTPPPPPPPVATGGAVLPELAEFGPTICLSGVHFTPNGAVAITYSGMPVAGLPSIYPSTASPHADATGKVLVNDETFDTITNLNCTTDQLFSTVTAVLTDVASSVTATVQLNGSYWCSNALLGGQSGDVSGCGL